MSPSQSYPGSISAVVARLHEEAWDSVISRPDRSSGVRISPPPLVCAQQDTDAARISETFPVLKHLQNAIELAKRHALAGLAERFDAACRELAWSQNASYTRENSPASFLDGYAYAAVSGPGAPIPCAAPRGGFMLIGPGVTYPPHQHAPREVYLILTPGAQWKLDEGDWFDVAPGDLIVHEPWVSHSMRTRAHPLLAFAGWLEPGDRGSIRWSGDSGVDR